MIVSARYSALDWLALRLDLRYVTLFSDPARRIETGAGLEIPFLSELYAKAGGGFLLGFDRDLGDLPYMDLGIGYSLERFFVEGVWTIVFMEDHATASEIAVAALLGVAVLPAAAPVG